MRVVVVGATGNVGTSLVRVLSEDDRVQSVLGVARRRPQLEVPKVEWATADVAEDDLVGLFSGADAVVHLAWAIQPSRDEAALRRVNVEGSARVAAATIEAGVPALVYASSVGTYSPGPQARRVDESWPTDGISSSFYSRHKAAVERHLDGVERDHPGLRVVRLRPALIFRRSAAEGIRRLFLGPFLPPLVFRRGLIPVAPWLDDLRFQAVHSDDVADAYRRAVLSDVRGAFNVAAEPVVDRETMSRLLGARVVALPKWLGHPALSVLWRLRLQPSPPGWIDMGLSVPMLDSSRARNELGWSPRHTAIAAVTELLEGLAETAGDATPPLAPSTSGRARAREVATGVGARDGGHAHRGKEQLVKAVTWQGRRDVRVEEVPDPRIEDPTDVVVRVTSTAICGSDLHLYEVLGPFLDAGDVLGHEAMGIVEEIGPEVSRVNVGDRVVVPFNISCGGCFMCDHGLHSQCETTQVHEYGTGASLFGYTKLYGQVPGGQAELLRVPFGDTLPITVPEGPPDDRFLFLSDVLPTAWQAVEYAAVPDGGSVVVLGLGPIGDMCCRIAQHRGYRAIGVDLVPERLERVRERGIEVVDLREHGKDLVEVIQGMTDGRGPDSVIDAVGMEAHGAPVAKTVQRVAAVLPDPIEQKMMQHAGLDRLSALHTAIELVRRGGTISVIGVYGGMIDPMPMMTLFDKQIQLRMGQANVLRWVPELMPLLMDGDPLGVDGFASHHVPLDDAPEAYAKFQRKEGGVVKVVLQP